MLIKLLSRDKAFASKSLFKWENPPDAPFNENDLWGWGTFLVLGIQTVSNSDLQIQDAIEWAQPAPPRLWLTHLQKVLYSFWHSDNALSAWVHIARTPGRFAVAVSVCCSSRSMHHDSHTDAVLAAMSTSGAVFPVLSEVWRSCALERKMVSETELVWRFCRIIESTSRTITQNHVLIKYANICSFSSRMRPWMSFRQSRQQDFSNARWLTLGFYFYFLILCAVRSWA